MRLSIGETMRSPCLQLIDNYRQARALEGGKAGRWLGPAGRQGKAGHVFQHEAGTTTSTTSKTPKNRTRANGIDPPPPEKKVTFCGELVASNCYIAPTLRISRVRYLIRYPCVTFLHIFVKHL